MMENKDFRPKRGAFWKVTAMAYIFEITAERLRALPHDALAAQASRALRMRVEQYSRDRLPGLWRVTDELRSVPMVSDAVLAKRRRRTLTWAVLCLIVGIFAFISGMMPPVDPVLLLAGAAAIGVSLLRLLRGERPRSSFDKAAGQMLDKLFSFSDDTTLRVTFSDTEMAIVKIVSGVSQNREAIPYSDFEYVIETDALYLLSYVGYGSVLPKNCIPDAEQEPFYAFLSSKAVLLRT